MKMKITIFVFLFSLFFSFLKLICFLFFSLFLSCSHVKRDKKGGNKIKKGSREENRERKAMMKEETFSISLSPLFLSLFLFLFLERRPGKQQKQKRRTRTQRGASPTAFSQVSWSFLSHLARSLAYFFSFFFPFSPHLKNIKSRSRSSSVSLSKEEQRGLEEGRNLVLVLGGPGLVDVARLGADLLVVLLERGEVLARLRKLALLHALADVPVHEGALGIHEVELVVLLFFRGETGAERRGESEKRFEKGGGKTR
jgi:hypothetical protein